MIISTTDEVLDHHLQRIKDHVGQDVFVYRSIEDVPADVQDQTEILLTFGNDLTTERVKNFPRLQWIQMFSAGLEDLPFSSLKQREILVTNAKGIHTVSMSEYVIGAMLYYEKHFDRFLRLKQDKVWDRETLVGELDGRSVLIYGTGTIGSKIAEKAKVFGMTVHGVNTRGALTAPFERVYTMEEAQSIVGHYEYVVLVLPSTPQTKGIISRSYLNQLNSEAVLINVGRGDVVDEDALCDLLQAGRIRGAVLDVFQKEPLPTNSRLWELDNVLITPHMSAKSYRYIDRCIDIFIKNYQCYREGHIERMINKVDLTRYY
ncbi:3-phosphoglycerate dehydrogenase [Caldalkalibacillus thermarum]|uniref:D-2-hydroxyacid dehydrogenase n=1 Tax=Caldalkalibacillus thermarum TaxID=296745 RepID=UPI001664E550|nr:D-2-hydroxyacid dehydrogenase [Caldalkalibacillus thermarum]GGK34472.1 3-phosphoglycerate dehydrogenase [Caldalkalibacillus thermarum]